MAINFLPADHRFAYAPNFSQIALSNDSLIDEALMIVFKARKRTLTEQVKSKFIEICQNFAGDTKIGALRQLSDEQWKNLKLPIMARLYLKHLINQSVSLNTVELLECDFMGGQPINLETYEKSLTMMLNMGFQRIASFEALVISRGDLAESCNYLLLPDNSKKSERERAKRLANNFVPPTKHHTVLAAESKAREEMNKYDDKSGRELKEEIQRIKDEIEGNREENKQLELEIKHKRRAHQKNLYREYLRGLLCDLRIDAVELRQLTNYRKNRDISVDQHKQVLGELGYTEEEFENLKDFKATALDAYECSVCFEVGRDRLILPCMHCCLCGDCAKEPGFNPAMNPKAQCPQCREKITEIRQVFF